MSEAAFADALTAENFVAVRDIFGGPAPVQTIAALARQRESEAAARDWLHAAREALGRSDDRQRQAVENLLA